MGQLKMASSLSGHMMYNGIFVYNNSGSLKVDTGIEVTILTKYNHLYSNMIITDMKLDDDNVLILELDSNYNVRLDKLEILIVID